MTDRTTEQAPDLGDGVRVLAGGPEHKELRKTHDRQQPQVEGIPSVASDVARLPAREY